MSPFSNEPMKMVHKCPISIVIGSFENEVLTLINIAFKISSPPYENGTELFSMIVPD